MGCFQEQRLRRKRSSRRCLSPLRGDGTDLLAEWLSDWQADSAVMDTSGPSCPIFRWTESAWSSSWTGREGKHHTGKKTDKKWWLPFPNTMSTILGGGGAGEWELTSFSGKIDSVKWKQIIGFSRQQQVNQRSFWTSQGQTITEPNKPARLCCQRATGDAQRESDDINSHSDAEKVSESWKTAANVWQRCCQRLSHQIQKYMS